MYLIVVYLHNTTVEIIFQAAVLACFIVENPGVQAAGGFKEWGTFKFVWAV